MEPSGLFRLLIRPITASYNWWRRRVIELHARSAYVWIRLNLSKRASHLDPTCGTTNIHLSGDDQFDAADDQLFNLSTTVEYEFRNLDRDTQLADVHLTIDVVDRTGQRATYRSRRWSFVPADTHISSRNPRDEELPVLEEIVSQHFPNYFRAVEREHWRMGTVQEYELLNKQPLILEVSVSFQPGRPGVGRKVAMKRYTLAPIATTLWATKKLRDWAEPQEIS